jgi:RecB family endonuclease NucS
VGDLSAVTQLRRYVEKIKKSKGLQDVRGILACPSITPNARKMLEDWKFSYVHVHPPKYLEKHAKNQMKLGEY